MGLFLKVIRPGEAKMRTLVAALLFSTMAVITTGCGTWCRQPCHCTCPSSERETPPIAREAPDWNSEEASPDITDNSSEEISLVRDNPFSDSQETSNCLGEEEALIDPESGRRIEVHCY